jgi:hypothetical protein
MIALRLPWPRSYRIPSCVPRTFFNARKRAAPELTVSHALNLHIIERQITDKMNVSCFGIKVCCKSSEFQHLTRGLLSHRASTSVISTHANQVLCAEMAYDCPLIGHSTLEGIHPFPR